MWIEDFVEKVTVCLVSFGIIAIICICVYGESEETKNMRMFKEKLELIKKYDLQDKVTLEIKESEKSSDSTWHYLLWASLFFRR